MNAVLNHFSMDVQISTEIEELSLRTSRPVALPKWPTSCRPSCCCCRYAFAQKKTCCCRYAFAQKTSAGQSTKPILDAIMPRYNWWLSYF